MRPWVSPYSCRRGPSANTTANRAPSCATPRERTPSARPTTQAPVNASLYRGWRAGSNGPPAANPAAPPLALARHARRPAGPEGGQLRPAPAPGGPGTRARLAAFQPSPARSAGGGERAARWRARAAGMSRPRLAAAAARRHPNEGGPPCSCRRGPTQPTRPRGRGRSAPGAREGSPSDGPGSQASPKACPAFGDGSRRGRGFLTAAGGTPAPAAAASALGPRGRRGQESPSRPPGGRGPTSRMPPHRPRKAPDRPRRRACPPARQPAAAEGGSPL